MERKPEFLFTADFKCQECGSIIGIAVFLALVKSHGAEVTCRHCKTRYLVTEEGAYRVDDIEQALDVLQDNGLTAEDMDVEPEDLNWYPDSEDDADGDSK